MRLPWGGPSIDQLGGDSGCRTVIAHPHFGQSKTSISFLSALGTQNNRSAALLFSSGLAMQRQVDPNSVTSLQREGWFSLSASM